MRNNAGLDISITSDPNRRETSSITISDRLQNRYGWKSKNACPYAGRKWRSDLNVRGNWKKRTHGRTQRCARPRKPPSYARTVSKNSPEDRCSKVIFDHLRSVNCHNSLIYISMARRSVDICASLTTGQVRVGNTRVPRSQPTMWNHVSFPIISIWETRLR